MPEHRLLSFLRVAAIVAMAAFSLVCAFAAGPAETGWWESPGQRFEARPQTLVAQSSAQPQPAGVARNPALQGGQAGRRMALVIGNDAYEKVARLEKAGNDALAMARELRAAGFEVLEHRNLNYRGMVKAVETFINRITGGDQVVVFFAGHGVQIRSGSYLLPVDIEASSEGEVEKTAYGLTDLTERLSEAKASFALVIVDACRDNPLKSKGRSVGSTRGLSAIEPPKGQMVVYSASKGQQALDRLSDHDQDPNGVFTREFIARMKRPGVRIEDLVREVQDAVEVLASKISHEQRPALYNESRGSFFFYGPTVVVQVQPTTDPEGEAWRAAQEAASIAGYQAYLDSYPNGRYAAAAKVKLAVLKKPDHVDRPVVAPPPPVAVEDPETQFWNEVKASGAREYLDAYLKKYPRGKYVALARIELKKLDDRDKAQQAREDAEKQQADERERQEALRTEQAVWEEAKAGASTGAYAAYLARYPKGRYAVLAQAAQQKLQREAGEREKQDSAQRRQVEDRQKRTVERDPRGADKTAGELQPDKVKVFRDCPDCPEMVEIPAGSFEMGSPASEAGRFDSEGPQHRVSVNRFAAGKFEVTRGQFAAFVNASGYNAGSECYTFEGGRSEKRSGRNWQNPGYAQAENHPVVCVSWDDAKAYIAWLSQKTNKSYRLLSEAEWEYAARAGSSTARYWGASPDAACAHANVMDATGKSQVPGISWEVHNCNDGSAYTAAVGSYKPNAFGLYDMIGNVWEWTEDCWNKNYTGAPSDGAAWTTGECSVGRVLRGASWYFIPRYARVATRDWFVPSSRNINYGFRLARTLP
ncbi:MAG: SUMF1/EgtB/PvdO family nonheme iron enzyme [Candidatus Accumulibacter sp.]|uniref:SUMF1/EgtB/PvdO family nonheme iron enzyme n=1 Tax=Accumulibacter sp. TaxID=2053492 RepID=UPI001AD18C46|nr:SUMF1/EgtB/PvdO family nonheme iron enzyme [Accumulibacter sp.]MBN8518142.1 SUMF1/EgtB/PvdO family nonheme iron enzyme [Accumulibacter sp.]MBO3711418.1 SUMF1/EgtB/PvdO family nonheme iron enzyme [Accumulibacter sp.]